PVDGLGDVLFCHATPRNDVDFFSDVTPEERLLPSFAGVREATVVCGHSHLQFDRRVGATRVVNAGSVGMAYEDEPGADWALLGPDVELRRTTFVAADLTSTAYPRLPWPAVTRSEARQMHAQDGL